MKKLFLIVSLVMAASMLASAATTNYNFTFQNSTGGFFCDGMDIFWYGSPKVYVDGIQTGCYSGYNTNGFKAAMPSVVLFDAPAPTGTTLVLGTATNNPSSLIYLVNTKYHTWVNWESGGGSGEFFVNYGFWTNGVKAQKLGTKRSGDR